MSMQAPNDTREIVALSPDSRIRIFRRTLNGVDEFDGMEVDAYVVLGAEHVVILDTLLSPSDVDYIMAAIEPELADKRLLCVNSHADWDHVWGNGSFLHRPATPIIAHDRCRQRLTSSEAQTTLNKYRSKSNAFDDVTIVAPTLTFTTSMTIADSALPIELLHAPGHRRDQIAAWLPDIRLLLGFDAVEKPLPCIEDSAGVPLMFSTLQRLAALNPRHVLCSHGNTSNASLIQDNLAYLQEIERRARLFLAGTSGSVPPNQPAATLIDYPFSEILASITEEIDRSYYGWAHEHNAQAILTYLREQEHQL